MSSRSTTPVPFTRKELYDLSIFCHDYALELARYDQHRVNLKECYRFNAWLARLKTYDRLAPLLAPIRPARPVARWQILVILTLVWGILLLALPNYLSRNWTIVFVSSVAFTGIALLFVPESILWHHRGIAPGQGVAGRRSAVGVAEQRRDGVFGGCFLSGTGKPPLGPRGTAPADRPGPSTVETR